MRGATFSRCEPLKGDCCGKKSHRPKIHQIDHKKDEHEVGAATGAVNAQSEAVSPGGAGGVSERVAYGDIVTVS